ncbi:scavenger receptor cysteine-rich type 1 protein M130 [Triplophysa dalaica]|uniref:scavenger receptor cysteine-rich type 1 protein M130 n=1 Tax=Triplophysa dalaica TaxID=1582913 RepID=UPI0024DFD8BB|nr:scavenger receptor cysteine-rich type 1 protein M130 [Triplophysa dalaica]
MCAAGQWRLASYSFTNGNKMSKMARTLLGLIFAVLINHFLFADICFAEGFNVRLINNLDNCFGRVEVLHNGTWGTVCGESWDISLATLVCRQLNCGSALTAHAWALFGEGIGPILSPVACRGDESSIEECFLEQNDCLHNQDAGVVCSASLLVIISAVIIAVVFLLCIAITIILVVRSKRRRQKQQISSSDCIQDVVTMHDVPHEDRYKESDGDDDDDYEKVDVDEDREDLNSNTEEDYVNMNEAVQTNVRSDHSEQDVNVETEDSEGDYVNVESEDSEQDYVNVEITKDRCQVDNNF